MNRLKKFLQKFSRLEILIVTSGLLVSLILVSVAFSYEKTNTDIPHFTYIQISETIKDVDYKPGNAKINPFQTSFYVAYDFKNENAEVGENAIRKLLNDELIYHHKLFDRHRNYYIDHDAPEAERELLHNLKYVNDNIGTEVEIAYPLYELLEKGFDYTLITPNSAFNMFVGELYDFWQPLVDVTKSVSKDPYNNLDNLNELNRILSNVPRTEEDLRATLSLRTEEGKYYAKLSKFNDGIVSLSVGALGKGYITDILKYKLRELNYVNGYIFGGSSSLTFLSDYAAQVTPIRLPSIKTTTEPPYYRDESASYVFRRRDEFSISTSGTYEGYRFKDDNDDLIIRSHILNPLTGYPAQQGHEAVSIVSNKLSGLELDYLSTALIVLSEAEGINFIRNNYLEKDPNIFYLGATKTTYYAHYTTSFPGGKSSEFDQMSEYREKILDFL